MTAFPSLVRSVSASGEVRYRLGDPLVDRYLEFVAGRARPNTLRAVAFDLKTFFTRGREGPGRGHAGGRVRVPRRAARRPDGGADQRSASRACRRGRSPGGCRRCRVSMPTRSLAGTRRCADESGAAGLVDPPRRAGRASRGGAAGAGAADVADDPVAGRGGPAGRGAAHAPGPGDGAGDGAGRAAPLRGARAAVRRRAGRRPAACSSPRARAAITGWCRSRTGSSTPLGDYLHDERPADGAHRPGVRGAEGPATRAAAVGGGAGRDPRRRPPPGRAGARRPATSCGTPA